jgi:hypothetical protein
MTPTNAHQWSASIDFSADTEQASQAAAGRAVMVDANVKVDCQMIKCRACHQTYESCHDTPCPGRPTRRLRL